MTDTEMLEWLERMAKRPGGILLHDGSETGRFGLGLCPGLCPDPLDKLPRAGFTVYSLRHLIESAAAIDKDRS